MHRNATIAAVAALLALAGCSEGEDKAEAATEPSLPSSSSASPSTSEAPEGPQRSDRGNIIKAFGEEGGVCGLEDTTCTADQLVLKFTFDGVTVDPECTSGFASPPDNGHYLGIPIRVSTSPDYPPDYYMSFSAADFSVIGPDGLTVSDVQGMASTCLGDDGFTQEALGPGQQYAGMVVIDSPVTSGTLVYAPAGEPTGWEWQF